MKKSILMVMAALTALVMAGCATSPSSAASSSMADPSQPMSQASSAMPEESQPMEGMTVEESLAMLKENEYPDLMLSAAVLERKAILPGFGVRLTVNIENKGDKTLVYTLGSGTSTTPDALMMQVDGLQPVMPEDHLGPATMDYQVRRLAPGESLQYDMYLMTIKPNASFDMATQELFAKEDKYIATMDWMQLHEMYPEFEQAAAGSYPGKVFFTYFIEQDHSNPPLGPTGYAMADFIIGVD